MGYTHYYKTEKLKPQQADECRAKVMPLLREIVEHHKALICDVTLNDLLLFFNGAGDSGETFVFKMDGNPMTGLDRFTKTSRCPYDLVVCECLIVLTAYWRGLSVTSDGFGQGRMDSEWSDAIESAKRFTDLTVDVEATKRRGCLTVLHKEKK